MLKKILLVVKREYLSRVRKRSFFIMTMLAPLLIVLFYGLIFYFAFNRDLGDTKKRIYVSDQSGLFIGKIKSKPNLEFFYGLVNSEAEELRLIGSEGFYAVLTIPKSNYDSIHGATMVANDQPSITTINYIEKEMEQVIKDFKLKQYGIDQTVIKGINTTNISIKTAKITSKGLQSSSAGASTAIGYICAILIYLFIFLYGVQVMRGVIEEKTNRIVEIIISSLKPFELMMGKIVGIALVGLTQFVIWIFIIFALGSAVSGFLLSSMNLPTEAGQAMQTTGAENDFSNILQALSGFNYGMIITMFIFYFISGYLFYGSLFAAIGSAVDNETDTQQFMMPITLPLVFAFVLAQSVVTSNPNGALSFWLSIIPLTSPVVMMVRIPFGVPLWEVLISMAAMTLGFVFTVWLAGRIYRVGILMYGKKPSYKELGKWLFYKE